MGKTPKKVLVLHGSDFTTYFDATDDLEAYASVFAYNKEGEFYDTGDLTKSELNNKKKILSDLKKARKSFTRHVDDEFGESFDDRIERYEKDVEELATLLPLYAKCKKGDKEAMKQFIKLRSEYGYEYERVSEEELS